MEKNVGKRLESFEKMYDAIKREYEDINEKMDALKAQDRVKSATYRQLMGRKLMYTNMLDLYKLYDLE